MSSAVPVGVTRPNCLQPLTGVGEVLAPTEAFAWFKMFQPEGTMCESTLQLMKAMPSVYGACPADRARWAVKAPSSLVRAQFEKMKPGKPGERTRDWTTFASLFWYLDLSSLRSNNPRYGYPQMKSSSPVTKQS